MASAQVPAEDSVVGTATGVGRTGAMVDAHSGPNGENPRGTLGFNEIYDTKVTCLEVRGNTAVIGFAGKIAALGIVEEANGIARVVDHGNWFDSFEILFDAVFPIPGTPQRPLIPAPTDCSSYPGAFGTPFSSSPYVTILSAGDLVVTDVPLPPPPPPGPPKYSVERETDLQWVLSRGITLELTCESACRLRARLYLGVKQARRHGLATGREPVAVAKANGRLTKAGDLSMIVTFNPRIRKRLKAARVLKLVLKTTLTAGDHSRTQTYPVRLRAAKH
jgi:hypothetical protein